MCGIVYTYALIPSKKNRASKIAFSRYKEQKIRGKDGFGCVSVDGGKINKLYRSVDEDGIRPILGDQSDMVLFHHRHPTSTPNYAECTHPIFVSNELLEYDYYVVHNGIISNDKVLKERHEKLGFEYTTEIKEVSMVGGSIYETGKGKFNDSEAFAIDLAIAIEEGKESIESLGSIAFVAMQVNKETKDVETIFFGRNTNPLKMHQVAKAFTLASLGVGNDVDPHTLYAYDVSTKSITKTDLKIGHKPSETATPSRSFMHSHHGSNETHIPGYNTRDSRWNREIPIDGSGGQQRLALKSPSLKKDRTVKKGHVDIKNKNGDWERINFNVMGDFLFGTSIHVDKLGGLENWHWEWYLRVIKLRNEFIADKIKAKRSGDEAQVKMLVERISKRSEELGVLSDIVNEKAVDEDGDKF